MRSGITHRWLRGSLFLTVLLVLLVESMFVYNFSRSYYNSVQQTMMRRFSSINGQLKMYTGDTAQKTAANRSVALRRMVEQFADKDKYEFMLLDGYGGVIASSSGTGADGIVVQDDFNKAQDAPDGVGVAIYRTASGETVMAVCSLVPYAAEDVAAMRLVTSLTLVDRQWYSTLMVSFGVAAVVLGFAVFSGLFFIRTIVRPLGQVEATANRIAHGDLTTRLPDAPYDDEIGRLCKAINQMAEDLTKTERMKNEFISSVSHELRTPLTSIKGWVETIANIRDPGDENYRKGITIIRSETDRLYDMVEELLDFSRLQNGIKLNCEVLDFVAEATDAALFVEARIRQEGLHLVYDEPPEPYPVWADPARLRQVFVNVFDNAIKYSPPEGTIFFTLTRTATTVTASIRDQGRGIAPDDLQNVKMKFFKAKNAVRGSGIGLAVVDEITKALGGTADITSTLGQGTTVTITLPIYHAGQEHLHEPI